jgi:hypothetical protein
MLNPAVFDPAELQLAAKVSVIKVEAKVREDR